MKKILFALLALTAWVSAAVNYPYPQNSTYGGRGIRVQSPSTATLKTKFTDWIGNYYEVNPNNANEARIKFDNKDYTVSEGIGYGMLMMVYFSDNSTSYQSHFDKLWTYYKNRRNNNGTRFMNWKINGFGTSCNEPAGECNGATDGDLDVALALIMGYHQFGVASYLTEGTDLIAKIRAYEIETAVPYYLKPGDVWNAKRNPSYFAPVVFELGKSLDAAGNTKWTSSLAVNYTLVKNNQHVTTGLVSDWAKDDGTVEGNDQFSYDASRTPWRLATAYYWYGHSDAKTILDKMGNWIVSKTGGTAGNIKAGYYRSSGDQMASYSNGTFTGAFASSLISNATHQSYLNAAWTSLMSMNTANEYFNGSIQILAGLLISGNMPNLAAMGPPSSSSSTVGSSSSAAATDLIDDLEDGNYMTKWGGEWYTYNDHNPEPDSNGKGASTVTPLTSVQPRVYFTPTAGGATGSAAYGAKINFTLAQGTFIYTPFVGIGITLRADEAYHNLTSCTQIQYKYKGYRHRFRLESQSVTNSNFHGFDQAASGTWTTVTLGFNDLLQENWGAASPTATLDKSKVRAFS